MCHNMACTFSTGIKSFYWDLSDDLKAVWLFVSLIFNPDFYITRNTFSKITQKIASRSYLFLLDAVLRLLFFACFLMEKFGAAVCCVAIGMAAFTQLTLHLLDQATAEQCKNHAWPAHADQVHRDWCIANNYEL